MIGALLILDQDSNAGKFIHHKFAGRSIAEHSATAYLRAEQIQRVIMIMPQSERKYVSGTSVQSSLFSKDRVDTSKKLDVEFYVNNADEVSFAHQVAVNYGLDHVVIGKITSGLMPQWFINDVVYRYFSINSSVGAASNFDEHFSINVMPFWELARIASHSDDRRFGALQLPKFEIENGGECAITRCKHKLTLETLEQTDLLNFMYSELIMGVDINDIIEEVNDK
jgi:hypothetical protein